MTIIESLREQLHKVQVAMECQGEDGYLDARIRFLQHQVCACKIFCNLATYSASWVNVYFTSFLQNRQEKLKLNKEHKQTIQ